MRFITLSAEESAALEAVYLMHRSPVARRRSQCLLLSSRGHTIQQLTGIFSICRITVYNWFDHWQSEGVASLTHKPGKGRKRKLAPISQPVLEDLVRANPQNLNAVRQELATVYSVACSKDTLRRHLKKVAMAIQTGPQFAQVQT